ncbi:DUF4173 domain-containing protein [Planctomycetota bacterium]|nr:DUF4173 domain-containing protein [Planctomycetota bacterium]
MDVYYLWMDGKLPEGMTYANYAHRAAYPLVAAALLAGLFTMISSGKNQIRRTKHSRLIHLLNYFWIAQNIILISNAGYRLSLYVEIYSLTRWRIAAAIWMTLVALGLITLIIKIASHRTNYWLIRLCFLYTYLIIIACIPINIDKFIADYNVGHCKEITQKGADIDLDYLFSLGTDALPAMDHLYAQINNTEKKLQLIKYIYTLEIDLSTATSDWRSWNYQNEYLLTIHNKNRPIIFSEKFNPPIDMIELLQNGVTTTPNYQLINKASTASLERYE